MGLDQPKGPEIPKLDMYGKPIKPGQKYDMTGKPIGQDYAGPHMNQMAYDQNGQPVNMLAKKITGMVTKIVIASIGFFVLLFVGIFWLVFSLLSGPSGAAEEYLIELPDVGAESANFHYGSINNDVADLVGNYRKDGNNYPVWVHLEKSGDDWVVIDFANTPPQSVIDDMNDDVDFDD